MPEDAAELFPDLEKGMLGRAEVQADPSLKAPPGFQNLIVKKENSAFILNLVSSALAPLHLGSCALVAVADSMLGKKRGPEIDAHDTVFRYNGPIKAYKADIGTKVKRGGGGGGAG